MPAEMRYTNKGTKRCILAQAIARKNLPMSEDDIRRIFAAMFDANGLAEDQAYFYPIKHLLNQIKKQYPNPSEAHRQPENRPRAIPKVQQPKHVFHLFH